MLFFIFLILLGLGTFIFIQYQKHRKANQLYLEAKALERKDTNSPYDLTKIKQALALYKQCTKLVNKPEYVKAVKQCQKKIDDRYRFQNLLTNGRKKASKSYFKEALIEFVKAQKLFNTSELKAEISKCRDNIKQQESYEKDLKQSAKIARQGKFKEALDLLRPIVNKFPRQDGKQLLAKLEKVRQAKGLYNLGLFAEEKNNLEEARTKYEKALDLLPEFTECKIRLSILTVKQKPRQAISYLHALEGEQAAYIRGFAYAQLGNWQQADRKWQSITNSNIEIQRHTLKDLVERDRLNSIWEIEKLVDNEQLEIAKTVTLEFIKKFDNEATIKHNLENHIQPVLERQVWYTENWQKIATKTEQTWLEKQDIESLHNWAIATYYQAQTNPSKLTDFIVAWSTALANLDSNPTLKNVPWLGSNTVDTKDVSAKLKQILEDAIDAIKDSNVNQYLKLRDLYRREMVALSLVKQNNYGMRIKQQLFILPGCYRRFSNSLPKVSFPAKIWGALYTDRGLAFAACYEGDIARAIKLKPSKNPVSKAESFADCFVSYHEGCYYLQNLEWQKAVKPLQQAKPEIKAKSDWCKKIDELCGAQRQKINNFNEHLQLSKFWYELLDSKSARSYFAEQSAIQVGFKIDDKKIGLQQGLDELRKIRNNIDRNNATTLDLIEKVEFSLAAEKIDRLLQQNQYEEAIRVAKGSQNEAIRYRLAEIFIDVLLRGTENRSLNFEGMYQLAKWAYQLCPYEPAFTPIYRELGIY